MSKQTALKPCPFCGSCDLSVTKSAPSAGSPHYYVICNTCFCTGRLEAIKDGATRAWNLRASTTPSKQHTETLAVQLIAAMIQQTKGDVGGRDQERLFAEIALDFIGELRNKIEAKEA